MDNKLTVIMCEHNSESVHLKQAIESILNQTYKDFIFMIVDDFTTDENRNILAEFAKKDARIQIIKNEQNLGLVKSLNNAVEMTSTKYIARMDTDDISHETRLEKQINFMEQNPEYAVIGTRGNYFDDDGIYLTSNMYGEVDIKVLVRFCVFFHPSIMLKTDVLKQVDGYEDYERTEDYALYFKLYYNGFKGYILNDVLIDYRQDKNSYKRKKYSDRIVEFKVRKKYYKLLKINPVVSFVYMLKPLIVGLIPKTIMREYKKRRDIR